MQAYLQNFALWVPSTFYEYQKGHGGTWKHPRTGAWMRGDYIGIPRDWQLTQCVAKIDLQVDLALKREDHRVAGVTFGWTGQPVRAGDGIHRRQIPIAVDILRDHLQGPERSETIADLLRYVPDVPWTTDVHTHTDLLQSGLKRWLGRHYIRGSRRPKRRLSDQTWDLICAKKDRRDELFRHQRLLHQRTLRACWNRWIGKIDDDVIETVEEARGYATTLKEFRALGGRVTFALRQDDKNFFEEMAKETGEMDEPGRCREFWRRIRGAFPKFKEKAKNSPLSLDVLDAQWMPHFSRLEAGSEITPGNLLTQCVQRQERHEKEEIALESMPTRHEVEMILRSLQSNKAAGPDGIPGDLYKNAAAGLAEHIHDLWSKITYWCAEPVQAKGGLMFPILKKGDPGLAGNYRGIMLLDVLSKTYHRWLRQQMMSTLSCIRMDTQIGGFKGQQAVFGAHCIQSVARIAHEAQCPMACLFVDIQGAYHFLVRELVVGYDNKADIDAVLANLVDWKADTRGLEKWLELPGILERARFPTWLIRVLREVHTNTWAQMPSLSTLLRTSRGSRPGSPLADVIYAALMFDIHIEIYRILEETPAVVSGYGNIGVSPLAVTWADDLAVPIVLEDNEAVVPALREVLRRVFQAFERRGLLLNLQKGKTTAVIACSRLQEGVPADEPAWDMGRH